MADTSAEARLTAMFRDHFDFIWRLLRRSGLPVSDADDVAQQVFVVATRKLERIEVGSERTFLYGTALRHVANHRRSLRRQPKVEALSEREPSLGGRPDQEAELSEAWATLDELLLKMPQDLARVLALCEVEELEVKTIAMLEGIPVGTAASRLRRARAHFRELVLELGPRRPFGSSE